jgi:ABC-2 type transport system permease protein
VNEDGEGTYSTLLLDQLENLGNLDIELLSQSDADLKLEKSNLLMVVCIPERFSGKLLAGEPTQLIFRQRGNGGQEGQIVANMVRAVAEEIHLNFRVRERVENALEGRDIAGDRMEETVNKFMDREKAGPIVEIHEEGVGSSPDPVNLFLPGIVTMFVLFSITLNGRAIVEERKKGLLERLLVTRLGMGQIFLGKFLTGMFRGFVQTFILLSLAYLVFQLFTPYSFVETLVVTLVFVAGASAVGLVIASIARTEDQAIWIAVFITMSMVMLGGTFFEISKGSLLHTISRISLNTYGNQALKRIMVQGGNLSDVTMELGVLIGVALSGLALSRILFKVMPEGK